MTASLDNRVRSPWRQPMVWLLVAIPLLAVVATAGLIFVAGGADPVRRTAQVQVADLGPDAHARALGLSALVRSGKGLVEVLPVAGEFDRNAPLTLALRHPTLAAKDQVLVLMPSETGWRTRAQVDLGHDWNVQVAGAHQGAWRLQGRWPAKQAAVYVAPVVGQ